MHLKPVLAIAPAGHNRCQIGIAGQVHTQPAGILIRFKPIQFDRPIAFIIGRHVHERFGGMIQPDIQVQLAEGLAITDAALTFLRKLAQPLDIGIAMAQAGIDAEPDFLIGPVAILRGLEQHWQDRRIVNFAARDLAGIIHDIPGDVFLTAPRRGGNHQKAARRLDQTGTQHIPEFALLPGVQFVGQHKDRGAAVLRTGIGADRFAETAGLWEGDAVAIVQRADMRRDFRMRCQQPAQFLIGDARLLAIRCRGDDFAPAPAPVRPCEGLPKPPPARFSDCPEAPESPRS